MLGDVIARLLFGSIRHREHRETLRLWRRTERDWHQSVFAKGGVERFSDAIADDLSQELSFLPRLVLQRTLRDVLVLEDVGELEVDWPTIKTDAIAAAGLREMLARRQQWLADPSGNAAAIASTLRRALTLIQEAAPAMTVGETSGDALFCAPLIDLLQQPAKVVEQVMFAFYNEASLSRGLFLRVRQALEQSLLTASGLPRTADIKVLSKKVVLPSRRKSDQTPAGLMQLYLQGTPLIGALELAFPFYVADEARFEHCHVIGGTGHGKTQLMQRMIHADLVAAQGTARSVVVIDSQGDLINKIVRLALFSPEVPQSLADRLILIDPADVEFPAALNLFDAHLARLRHYRPVDQERVLNGVIELYETFFGALLGAELTQKQGVIFKFIARLMVSIEGSTIHTLMALMEDGRPFKKNMEALDGSARYFFENEFFDPSFRATKKQILKRLWGVLSTPAFERMFAQKENKLDLFNALNEGKIILVSTAKDLLKQEGSALFGRFFIALIAQAALERSTLPEYDRTPTMVYVDEAQEYFGDDIETILNQARKYRVGLTIAHQTLDQLSPRLRSALLSNTSMKCVGGVSAKDARALADELRTTSDFIESMKRRKERTEFAVWIKQQTPSAIRLSAPLGFLESQPLATEEAFAQLMEANRERYCGTFESVQETMRAARTPAVGEQDAQQSERTPSEQRPVFQAAGEAEEAAFMPSRPRTSPELRQMGKGGSQHRYVQHLVKGLAEERGFRVVIEEAVAGGQVDVVLHRDELAIACEISVTSTAEHEAQNLAKCLRGGFGRVWAIAPDQKRRRIIEEVAKRRLSDEEFKNIEFLTTEDLVPALQALEVPEPAETTVRGYKVKVSRTVVSPSEAKDRRATIARVVAQSMGRLDDKS